MNAKQRDTLVKVLFAVAAFCALSVGWTFFGAVYTPTPERADLAALRENLGLETGVTVTKAVRAVRYQKLPDLGLGVACLTGALYLRAGRREEG